MSLTVANLTIHCANAARLAAFWATALRWTPQIDNGSATLTDPSGEQTSWYFEDVDVIEHAPGRLHLDLDSAGRHDEEVTRLLTAGASTAAQYDGWTVLADPEGNLFCVLK